MALAAGIILILISIVHIIFGEKQSIAQVSGLTDDPILIGSVRVMSTQGGVLLFAVGVVDLLSFFGVLTLSGAAAFFPLGIVLINFGTFLALAIFKHRELLSISVVQIVVFTIIIILQALALHM